MGDPKGFVFYVCCKDYSSSFYLLFSSFHRVLLCTVRSFSVALCKNFFEEKYFSKNLWQLFFNLCTTFITQPSLKVEELSDYKRYKSLTRYVCVPNCNVFDCGIQFWRHEGGDVTACVHSVVSTWCSEAIFHPKDRSYCAGNVPCETERLVFMYWNLLNWEHTKNLQKCTIVDVCAWKGPKLFIYYVAPLVMIYSRFLTEEVI